MPRTLLAAAVLVLTIAGCADPPPRGTPVTRAPPPPTARPFTVGPDEPAAAVKGAAVRFVEALTAGPASSAESRLRSAGQPARLAAAAVPLLADAGAAEVIYPQLGGLTRDSASVMMLLRVRPRRSGQVGTATRTVEIRLARSRRGWRVVRVASTGGAPPRHVADRSSAAAAVLSDDRIQMTDSARWDIEAGRVDARLLRLLTAIAAKHTISVTVLATGHPHQVYGTGHVSNHTRGRAVDIWAVDGTGVARQRTARESPAKAVARQALVAGATEVGAPWALGAGGSSTFTNRLHQDHLHIAFDR
ncbi:hypothetical protein [Actinomadura rubrisoli]|uniref:Extensin-like C-terminal domain-containing protein n=1 Tax=Actinomadura rubrisoli TaxID=2530368 RepID=A0A4R5BI71_9ACTN|nr:hypothetical protein [Actinomadura rubrisoli]TDD85219.1 hypothetical protein E1298_18875 [Actinomadura rubrisoli]